MVNVSQEPARDQGWTRTAVEVQLASASSGGAVIDLSVRVGIDGGSWKDDDKEVVRIVGWAGASGGGYDPSPQELQPGDLRRFVYEARSDLAIDVETKLDEM